MSRARRGPPPGWARRLLESVLPIGAVGESIRGDLESEYHELRGPQWRARLWYSLEAIKLTVHYRRRHVRR